MFFIAKLCHAAKTQTANRLRRSGNRLSKFALPTIGQKVWFRRPVHDNKKFKAKYPAALPNVQGTITVVSTVGFSYYVEWEDENQQVRVASVFPSEIVRYK